jgi:transcriptional regulator with XRE-family HTH domain
MCAVAKLLTKNGATDREVAESLGVSESTVHIWKREHPEFLQSLRLGKDEADDRVVQSLYRRATGYSFDSEKIFPPKTGKKPIRVPYVEHIPPDVTACIFWLKNRRREEWRDRHELTSPDAVSLLDVLKALAERLPV